MSNATKELRLTWAHDLARASAAVANFCDHAEHNEQVELSWVRDSARRLREIACEAAAEEGLDLRGIYAARLRAIEEKNPLGSPDSPDGGTAVETAETWRDLQLAQAAHDRYYHCDVIGLTKAHQLLHYALHLAKLAGAYAELASGEIELEDFHSRRLPDTLLFGLKLSTVTGKRLPDSALADSSRLEPALLRVA